MGGLRGGRASDEGVASNSRSVLSSSLFALCTASVISLLPLRLFPEDLLALFADDLTVVVAYLKSLLGLHAAFAEGLRAMSASAQSVLWPCGSRALRQLWKEHVAGWGDFLFARMAKYLGSQIGPAAPYALRAAALQRSMSGLVPRPPRRSARRWRPAGARRAASCICTNAGDQ